MSNFIYWYAECQYHYADCQYAESRYAECCYAECHYAECRYAECRYADCLYAECHYAECHNTECHGAILKTVVTAGFNFSSSHPERQTISRTLMSPTNQDRLFVYQTNLFLPN